MNTLIVPTDFSAYSENILHYAAGLAKRIEGSLLLLNVYQLPVTMNEPPVLTVLPDDLKANADIELSRLKEMLYSTHPDVVVETESRLGDLNDELRDLCKEVRPFAIVTGRYNFKGFERFLFGDNTLSIIRHSDYPVIVAPENFTLASVDNLAVAVDASPGQHLQQEVKRLASQLKARLHVIHVTNQKEKESDLRNVLLPELNAYYHAIHDDKFMEGITAYLNLHKIDLLVVYPHKHSTLERLVIRTHTKDIIEKSPVPVMCLPEERL